MVNEKLIELLNTGEPELNNSREENEFSPAFNVREEFALWIREEFSFYGFGNRRREVYKAAKHACKDGIRSTQGCLRSWFKLYNKRLTFNYFLMRREKFTKDIYDVTKLIEKTSPSLGGEVHYGTSFPRRRFLI